VTRSVSQFVLFSQFTRGKRTKHPCPPLVVFHALPTTASHNSLLNTTGIKISSSPARTITLPWSSPPNTFPPFTNPSNSPLESNSRITFNCAKYASKGTSSSLIAFSTASSSLVRSLKNSTVKAHSVTSRMTSCTLIRCAISAHKSNMRSQKIEGWA
jgi:hypothetical protein